MTWPSTMFVGLSAEGHGGIQRFNRRVADALIQLEVPTETLMLDDPSGAGGSRLRFAASVLRRARQADLLLLGHVNLLPLALAYRLMRPRGRVILFAHGIEIWGDPAYRRARSWERWALRHAVDVIAIVSRYSRERMMAAFRLDEARFTMFPNAVDLLPDMVGNQGAPMILSVARLGAGEREKHIDKIVRAMPRVLRELPDARLMVIGRGPLREELEALAADLGVSDRVVFPGAVEESVLEAAYREARVFALPSVKEGFGIVFLEAWAHGLPVIGAPSGGAGELIVHGVDGLTVDPHDEADVARALVTLLGDEESAARMGGAGRAKVERQYSAAAFVANLRRLIEQA